MNNFVEQKNCVTYIKRRRTHIRSKFKLFLSEFWWRFHIYVYAQQKNCPKHNRNWLNAHPGGCKVGRATVTISSVPGRRPRLVLQHIVEVDLSLYRTCWSKSYLISLIDDSCCNLTCLSLVSYVAVTLLHVWLLIHRNRSSHTAQVIASQGGKRSENVFWIMPEEVLSILFSFAVNGCSAIVLASETDLFLFYFVGIGTRRQCGLEERMHCWPFPPCWAGQVRLHLPSDSGRRGIRRCPPSIHSNYIHRVRVNLCKKEWGSLPTRFPCQLAQPRQQGHYLKMQRRRGVYAEFTHGIFFFAPRWNRIYVPDATQGLSIQFLKKKDYVYRKLHQRGWIGRNRRTGGKLANNFAHLRRLRQEPPFHALRYSLVQKHCNGEQNKYGDKTKCVLLFSPRFFSLFSRY